MISEASCDISDVISPVVSFEPIHKDITFNYNLEIKNITNLEEVYSSTCMLNVFVDSGEKFIILGHSNNQCCYAILLGLLKGTKQHQPTYGL